MEFVENWTLKLDKLPKYTTFTGTFNEPIDKKLCLLILNSNDSRITSNMKLKLQKLYDVLPDNGVLKVNHNQRNDVGRFYADNELSTINLPRLIKHTIYKYSKYIDIDMVSAHASIALAFGKKNNVVFDGIYNYVNNRDTVIDDTIKYYSVEGQEPITKDDAKFLFNMMLYGGGFKTWKEDTIKGDIDNGYEPKLILKTKLNEHAKKFKDDCKLLKKLITDSNEPLMRIIEKETDDKHETLNRCVSYWFHAIENHLLFVCYKHLLKVGIIIKKNVAPEYDGLCIPCPAIQYDRDIMITNLNNYIKEQTKLDVKFKIKGYDTVLENILDERSNMNDDKIDEKTGVKTDMEAAEKLYKLYPHWVNCYDTLFVFDNSNGLWTTSKTSHNKVIQSFSNDLHVMAFDSNKMEWKMTHKSYGNTNSLRDRIPSGIMTLCINNNWMIQNENSSLGKILFNNGYYDFHQEKFYGSEDILENGTRRGFNPNIVFFGKIHQDFEHLDGDEEEYLETIKKRFFYDSLGEACGNYFITNLARGLAGDVMKRVMFGLGKSNTGKGILTNGLQLSLGDYFGSFNGESLAYRNSSNDEAQNMRWVMLLKSKRIIVSNEMKSTVELNGNMIKKIASGGDPIIARGHQANETEFKTHFLPIILANDLPKIKPYDDAVDKRTKVLSYTKCYVENPEDEFELQADEGVKEEIKTKKFQKCFVWMLLMAYMEFQANKRIEIEPIEVLNAKKDWIDTEKTVIDKFLLDYEITGNPDDFIWSSEIDDWIKEENVGISIKKFGAEMKDYCKKQKINTSDEEKVYNKDKKLQGKTKRVWIGIKELEDNIPIASLSKY